MSQLIQPYRAWGLLLLVLFFLIAKTAWDYGVSWDEVFRTNGGEKKLAYYQALLDGDAESANSLRAKGDRYPGLFDLSLALLRRVSPVDDVSTGHLLSSLFGMIGIVGTMFLGRCVGGPWLGLLAGVLIALCPRYWGHMFINPKDIPFAATFVWGIWAFLRALPEPDKKWIRTSLIFGLAAGACMSVRVGGLLLFFYAGLFMGIGVLWKWWHNDRTPLDLMLRSLRLIRWILLAGSVAFLILFIFWPSMHVNPFVATTSTLAEVSNFGWAGFVRFQGVLLSSEDLPWYYLIHWLAITVPDLWYFVLLSAFFAVLPCFVCKTFAMDWALLGKCAALLFAASFPVAYIILKGSTVYDGMRHILFVLPSMAVLLGALVTFVLQSMRGQQYLTKLWLLASGLLVAVSLLDAVSLHPYQYTYFNRLSGGLAKRGGFYDTDYWGTSYREGIELLGEWLPKKENGESWRITMEPPLKVLVERMNKPVVPPPALVEPFLREDFILVRGHEAPELYIATTRNGYNTMRDGELLCQVQRAGVVFVEVKLLNSRSHDR